MSFSFNQFVIASSNIFQIPLFYDALNQVFSENWCHTDTFSFISSPYYTHVCPLVPPSLQQVLSVQPRNTQALFHRALAYHALQNLQKSEELLLNLLKLSPAHKDGLYYLGLVYFKGQRYGKAAEVWKKLDRNYRDVASQLKLAEKHAK